MVLRLGPASEWLVWPIPALLSPFAGRVLPAQRAARLDARPSAVCCRPPMCSRACAALARAATATRAAAASLIGIALALLDIVLAAWVFLRVYRYAVRTGLLARYSAESAG